MNFSYWEHKTWLSNVDFTIVGSGIVGLSCALHLKERFPSAKVLVLEKGMLPQGASTKNAGFACFGSISEVLEDLESHSEQEVVELVEKRYQGIHCLRSLLGVQNIGFEQLGGHELFLESDMLLYEQCSDRLYEANKLLKPIFGKAPFVVQENRFQFQQVAPTYITHQFEGQIDTGNMMASLLKATQQKEVLILNGIEVQSYFEGENKVVVKTNDFEVTTNKLLIATNGFANTLLKEDVMPVRAQVLITEPIPDLNIKGTFHFNKGYYYFRNVDNRILFGGGRNLDFKGEETSEFGQTNIIQNQLDTYLTELILPNTPFEVATRWSGIMGVGQQKKPIIKQVSNHTFCGIRMGGMGVAIGSLVGKELASLL